MYTFAPLPLPESHSFSFVAIAVVLLAVTAFLLASGKSIVTEMVRRKADASETAKGGGFLLLLIAAMLVLLFVLGAIAYSRAYLQPVPVNKEVVAEFEQFVPLREIRPGVKTFETTTDKLFVQVRLESTGKSVLVPFHAVGEMPKRVVLYWNPGSN